MSFRHLSPEQLSAISRKGGQSSQARGTAYRWNKETARAAGSKGGVATAAKKRAERLKSEEAAES